jgi:hypothetical protein
MGRSDIYVKIHQLSDAELIKILQFQGDDDGEADGLSVMVEEEIARRKAGSRQEEAFYSDNALQGRLGKGGVKSGSRRCPSSCRPTAAAGDPAKRTCDDTEGLCSVSGVAASRFGWRRLLSQSLTPRDARNYPSTSGPCSASAAGSALGSATARLCGYGRTTGGSP